MKMRKIDKMKVITGAFLDSWTNKIPTKDKWPEYYKERMNLCLDCEYVTSNMTEEELKQISWWKRGAFRRQCSECGCFITKKCWAKVEACALEYLNIMPKWSRLEVVTRESDLFNMSNDSPEECNIDLENDTNMFTCFVGDVKQKQKTYKISLIEKDTVIFDKLHAENFDFDFHIKKPVTDIEAYFDFRYFEIGSFRKRLTINYSCARRKIKNEELIIEFYGNII